MLLFEGEFSAHVKSTPRSRVAPRASSCIARASFKSTDTMPKVNASRQAFCSLQYEYTSLYVDRLEPSYLFSSFREPRDAGDAREAPHARSRDDDECAPRSDRRSRRARSRPRLEARASRAMRRLSPREETERRAAVDARGDGSRASKSSSRTRDVASESSVRPCLASPLETRRDRWTRRARGR